MKKIDEYTRASAAFICHVTACSSGRSLYDVQETFGLTNEARELAVDARTHAMHHCDALEGWREDWAEAACMLYDGWSP